MRMPDRPETFRSSGAVVFGGITVVGALALAGVGAIHPQAGAPDWLTAGLVLLAVVVYVAQVRPAVVLGESELELRNMLESVYVPWAAIRDVQVRQFVIVEVGEREYNCAAVGRTRRQVRRDNREAVANRLAEASYGRFVETRIRNRASEARAQRGIAERSPEQDALVDGVRRVRAWPEVTALVAVLATFVTLILV